MHEHVTVGWDGTLLDSRLRFDMKEIEDEAVNMAAEAKSLGVRTIVDMTTIEMTRNVELIKRVADLAGMQWICCTGLFADLYGIPHYFRELTTDMITDLYVTELEKGIGDTGIRAGVVKLATSGRELTEYEIQIAQAAGRAAKATGVPVLTHTGRGGGGVQQAEILLTEGVLPHKIVIGHSDVSADTKYHLAILKRGVSVGFDRIGLPMFMPDAVRAGCIATLVKMGYAAQLTMSMDSHVRWLGSPDLQPSGLHTGDERRYSHLHRNFFPLLREFGVEDAVIDQIMIENPRRIFSDTSNA